MPGSYEPYLIGNMKTGLDLSLDPWLLPGDAYAQLYNCHTYQGRIEKRLGQSLYGTLSNQVWDIDSNQLVVDADHGGQAVVDPAVVTSGPIMGLFQFENYTGALQLIAMTQKRLFQYINGTFYDMAGADQWSGADSDFFHQDMWQNNMFLVNGCANDPLCYYNGKNVYQVLIDLNGDGANDVTGAYFVFAYKGRLILLNICEYGIRIPQRARWSDYNSYTSWPISNYLDAPTQDTLLGALFVGDQLTVFTNNSAWALLYTGNALQPFWWQRLPGVTNIAGKKAFTAYRTEGICIGNTRITECDGIQSYYIDQKIPKLVQTMNANLMKYSYSILDEAYSHVLLSYPSASAVGYPDTTLVLNFDEGSWAQHSFAMHVFGMWNQYIGGYPVMLAGDRSGNIWQINTGGTDAAGASITATIQSAKLNPYIHKEARKARFGWIDFLVNTSSGTMNVSLYAGDQSSPYATFNGVLLNDGRGESKSRIRIPADCTAAYHQFQITHSGSDQLVIHAAIPYFQRGGRLNG